MNEKDKKFLVEYTKEINNVIGYIRSNINREKLRRYRRLLLYAESLDILGVEYHEMVMRAGTLDDAFKW